MNTGAKDIARFAANETLKKYDRGVAWSSEQLTIKGQQWQAAYLPVWLYSYQEVKKNDKKLLHYVAVNARTKKTMGSVPIHMPKLLIISLLIELLGVLGVVFIDSDYKWFLLLGGIIYFLIIYNKYRNKDARHKHELETKRNMSNLKSVDKLVTRRNGLTNSTMDGANNTSIGSQSFSSQMLREFTNHAAVSDVTNFIKNNINK